jgi:hypothetical protein
MEMSRVKDIDNMIIEMDDITIGQSVIFIVQIHFIYLQEIRYRLYLIVKILI